MLETAAAAGIDAATAEYIAAVLAGHSDHPVSRAIAAGLRPNSVEAKDFKAIAGRGVQAEIDAHGQAMTSSTSAVVGVGE